MYSNDKKRICIYCSASNDLPTRYYEFAQEFGKLIAKNNYDLVYGGTTVGMMGVIASNAQKNGSHVIGVIPKLIASFGLKNLELSTVITTKDMRERKAVMEQFADIFITVPGGFGTLEEVFEILVAKQLGYHNKPIIFVNFDNYFDNMFKMFETIYKYHFAKEETKQLYYIANNLQSVFEYINNYHPSDTVLKF